jgi:hypothetical protein
MLSTALADQVRRAWTPGESIRPNGGVPYPHSIIREAPQYLPLVANSWVLSYGQQKDRLKYSSSTTCTVLAPISFFCLETYSIRSRYVAKRLAI